MAAPKPTKDQAAAHLLLCGWQAFYYVTPFEGFDGWCLWHEDHQAFRTSTGSSIVVRNSALPEGAKEVTLPELPASVFWLLFDRLGRLGLVPALGGHRYMPAEGEDRRG